MDTKANERADSASGHARTSQVATGSCVGTNMDVCFKEFGGPGARHAMFAQHRPHSSGSAQFCGILGERLLAPVSDENKHEAMAAAPPAEATAKTSTSNQQKHVAYT